jgi:manganese transport protein
VQVLAWLITVVLVYLNIRMVSGQATDFFAESDSLFWKSVIAGGGLVFVSLLLIALIYPLLNLKGQDVAVEMHGTGVIEIGEPKVVKYDRIAIALDLSHHDKQVIAYAMGQANPDTHFILIHIVESASARILGEQTADLETQKDQEKLEAYVNQLKLKGFDASASLGFRNRVKGIATIVKESKSDLLVIGAHGHSGVKDWFYGETIDAVRHQLKIPVLIVNL